MAGREFLFPDELELLDVLGIASEPVDGMDSTRLISLSVGADDEVRLTCDFPSRSVRFQWFQREFCIVDIFREGAVRFSLERDVKRTALKVVFEAASLAGELNIQIMPAICVNDRLLER